jgi:tetratricopeptide (TPR) repeat protein
MIQRFRIFLGPARLRSLFVLLAVTGLSSVILTIFIDQYDWVRPAQTALALVFVTGAVVIVGGRLSPYERGRWAGILLPAFGAVVLGVLLLPHLLLVMLGLAVGWVLAAMFLFKPRAPMQYREAVKYLRRNEYAAAVRTMDGLIKDEPHEANHYRFRAEVLRVWGKLDRARRDYEQMVEIAPDSPVAHNGLAEVLLQVGNYPAARKAAAKAYELAPGEWVAAYNLGMIEDRMAESGSVVEHLTQALTARVPDARHRVLIHFYLARAHARLGDLEAASAAIEALKKERAGVQEWRMILESDQAETLRKVILVDIEAVEALISGEMAAQALAE